MAAPSGGRSRRRDVCAGVGVAQCIVIMQRACNGARGECVMNCVGAERASTVQGLSVQTLAIQICIGPGGAIAAKTVAAGGTRESRGPAARCV